MSKILLARHRNESMLKAVAKRTCVRCNSEHFICDSDEFWTDAEPEELVCIQCGCKQANVGVGFPCMMMETFVGSMWDEDA